jgi:hypothetical protein
MDVTFDMYLISVAGFIVGVTVRVV